MNWLGLSPLQTAGIWLATSALAVWFYQQSRRPQRRKVSTLRFWPAAQQGDSARRWHITDYWALLVQLLFLLLVLVALGNIRWDSPATARKVILILDASVWSRARVPGEAPRIDQIRNEAQTVLSSLPAADEVSLISAAPDAHSIVHFTTDRADLRSAIAQLQSSDVLPNIPAALEIARGTLADSQRGLLVYIGPGMVDEEQSSELESFRKRTESVASAGSHLQFLVKLVGGNAPLHNQGITRLALRRDPADPNLWHLLTQIKNYGVNTVNASLKLSVAGQSIANERVPLPPGNLTSAENQFMWAGGGVLQAELTPVDELDADNRAFVNLPSFLPAQVALIGTGAPFSSDVLAAAVSNPYLQVEVVAPGERPKRIPDIAIYQTDAVPAHVEFNSIYFVKGAGAAGSHRFLVSGWNAQHEVTQWVRSRDVSVENPARLDVLPGDTVLATVDGDAHRPAVIAREKDGHRIVIVGFDPDNSNLARQSAFPLLIAGCVEWMTPSVEETAGSFPVGEVEIPGPASRIIAPSGADVPFTPEGPSLHLLAMEAGQYRVMTSAGEEDFFVNLARLPSQRLAPTPGESATIEPELPLGASWELWRLLAYAAIVALWMEWWLYYSSRRKKIADEIQLSDSNVRLNLNLDSVQTQEDSEVLPSNLGI